MESQQIANATKEQLVERYIELGYKTEEIEAEKQVLKEEILARLKDNGEVIGHYTVTRVKKNLYKFGTMTIEQARDFGAVKEMVDNKVLEGLYQKGVKLPVETTVMEIQYPLIKDLQPKE